MRLSFSCVEDTSDDARNGCCQKSVPKDKKRVISPYGLTLPRNPQYMFTEELIQSCYSQWTKLACGLECNYQSDCTTLQVCKITNMPPKHAQK